LLVAGYPLAATRLNWLVGDAAVISVPADDAMLTLVELALVLVLFTDVSTIDWRRLREEAGLAIRLLGVGPLLSIVFGTGPRRPALPGAAGRRGAGALRRWLRPTPRSGCPS